MWMFGLSKAYTSLHLPFDQHEGTSFVYPIDDVRTFCFTLNWNDALIIHRSYRHNTHQYIAFFKTIRQAIANGKVAELVDHVKKQFERRCLLDENIQKQLELDLEKEKEKTKKSVRSDEPMPSWTNEIDEK